MTTQVMPKVGDIILDKYEIKSMIGQGAMGCVYRGEHSALGRTFAIKVLQPQYTIDPLYKARFLREARINAQLTHDNAVQVYDTGEWNGWLYIVMEFLQGMPLRDWIIDGVPSKTQLVMAVAEQIAGVLVDAHNIGLVHRDLKPENIMVEHAKDNQIRLVVVDFGLAFIQESEEGMDRLTQDRTMVSGTPAYLSPEQAVGGELTTAADIYAFGCILYELLTGWVPFRAPTVMEVLTQHMFVPPTSLKSQPSTDNISPAFEDLVMRMLLKDPAQRPTAKQAHDAIKDILSMPFDQGSGRKNASNLLREQRMLEKTTQRNPAVQTSVHIGAHKGAVAFFRTPIESDFAVALASNGYTLFDAQTQEDCANAIAIVALHSDESIVEQLSHTASVVAGVETGDISRIQALLRAGASDVLPLPITPIDLVKKLNRIARKNKRRKS